MGKTLVAVAAHADDVELNVGGTAAKWAAAGGKIHVVMVTNNCHGLMVPDSGDESAQRRLPPNETTEIRYREQRAAAALIGAEVHFLNYTQRHYWDGQAAVSAGFENAPPPPSVAGLPQLITSYQKPEHFKAMGELIVGLRPDVVFTHGVLDVDPEHHAVCSLVWLAFQDRRSELARVGLRFWTPGSSCMWGVVEPNYDYFEDITDFYEKKLQLCSCHASQMTRKRLDMVKSRAEYYGRHMGVRYAEPFNTARNWDR